MSISLIRYDELIEMRAALKPPPRLLSADGREQQLPFLFASFLYFPLQSCFLRQNIYYVATLVRRRVRTRRPVEESASSAGRQSRHVAGSTPSSHLPAREKKNAADESFRFIGSVRYRPVIASRLFTPKCANRKKKRK